MPKLQCTICQTDLKLSIGYTGADWDCEKGEGSGYGHEVSLDCDNCGLVYKIGHVKSYHDFSPVVDKYKCVK